MTEFGLKCIQEGRFSSVNPLTAAEFVSMMGLNIWHNFSLLYCLLLNWGFLEKTLFFDNFVLGLHWLQTSNHCNVSWFHSNLKLRWDAVHASFIIFWLWVVCFCLGSITTFRQARTANFATGKNLTMGTCKGHFDQRLLRRGVFLFFIIIVWHVGGNAVFLSRSRLVAGWPTASINRGFL